MSQQGMGELELFEQPFPHSTEAEQAVLAALIADKDAITEVVDKLEAEDFYRTSHQLIYAACLSLFRDNHPVCLVGVSELLKEWDVLQQVGGFTAINELAASYMDRFSLPYHVGVVKDRSMARQIINAGFEIAAIAYTGHGQKAMEASQKLIFSLNQQTTQEDRPLAEIVQHSLTQLELQRQGKSVFNGVSTGFPAIDTLLGGLKKSNLIILAARPSMGKTALALNMASDVALRQQLPVLFYSLEMSPEELVQRMILSEAGGNLDFNRVKEKAKLIENSPLHIIDRPGLGIPQLRASIMRHRIDQEIGLVVIDYLQLMSGEGENRVQQVSNLSRELKQIAREFDVPILCLSQLSRAVEARQDKKPLLSDLRESGAIEQDADVVMFIYRDEYYNPESTKIGMAEVIIGKNRQGAVGSVSLNFRPATTKFSNLNSLSVA